MGAFYCVLNGANCNLVLLHVAFLCREILNSVISGKEIMYPDGIYKAENRTLFYRRESSLKNMKYFAMFVEK